jgi:hypothetical protein
MAFRRSMGWIAIVFVSRPRALPNVSFRCGCGAKGLVKPKRHAKKVNILNTAPYGNTIKVKAVRAPPVAVPRKPRTPYLYCTMYLIPLRALASHDRAYRLPQNTNLSRLTVRVTHICAISRSLTVTRHSVLTGIPSPQAPAPSSQHLPRAPTAQAIMRGQNHHPAALLRPTQLAHPLWPRLDHTVADICGAWQ